MAQEIGESREAWGRDVMTLVEDFASKVTSTDPFYIVYACKEDKGLSNKFGKAVFKQFIKAYSQKPPPLIGILVWFVDKAKGEFAFMPELSAPPDIPLDPKLLSDVESDMSARVAAQGEKLKVLVS
jgi:hypothetical protein